MDEICVWMSVERIRLMSMTVVYDWISVYV
jgi:hypothetical protein